MEGGDDRMRYSASVDYNNIAGVMKGSDRRTIAGNIKLSYRYKDLLFRNSLSITTNKAADSPYGSFSDYSTVDPYYTPYDENGNLKKVLGIYTYPGSNGASRTLTYYNPLYNASIGTKNFSKYTEYTENFYIEWRPLDYLRFTGRVGYTYDTNKREDFYPGDHTSFVNWTGDNYFKRGSYSITDGESEKLSADITANYTGQFGKHMILANAAWSLNSSTSNNHGMTAWGFLNNHVDDITFAKQYADNGRPSGSETNSRSIGLTGAVNYSYADRYLADVSLRFNGSSVFGSDNRWGTFWSVGLGWNLHKEKFMKNLEFVNLFKLRGSYGLTGSQNFNPYQAKATYKFYSDVVYDNIVGAYLMSLANNKLKWQQTADLNVGFDLQMFKSLNVRLDVYNSKTKDALLSMTLPTSTGFSSYQENLGDVQNKGYDATFNWRFYQKGSNYLAVTASVGHNTNKVVKISNALKSFNDKQEEDASTNKTTSPIIRYEEGQSMTAIWAVRSMGIDPITGQELFLKKDGSTTYDYYANDKVVCGDSNPKYHGNFGLSGEYKGIGLSCTFTYRLGGDYYNSTLVNRVENVDVAYNVDRRVLYDTWNKVGDIAKYKKIIWTPSITYPTSRFIEKNNELLLSSLTCYYDFKYQSWLRKIKVERLKLSFYMNDLFRLSTVKTERGLDYPYARSFSFSLSATF
jgi:TonB-linked SusC/RagA family outer membrane protein